MGTQESNRAYYIKNRENLIKRNTEYRKAEFRVDKRRDQIIEKLENKQYKHIPWTTLKKYNIDVDDDKILRWSQEKISPPNV